jgi:chorismate synthase
MIALVDGFPAGLAIDIEEINSELKRRQGGYGRGARQKLEQDSIEVLSGTWRGTTIGSPICLQVNNADFKLERLQELERPRPGHGDLSGAMKYLGSIRGILERASARETVVRVAAGTLASNLLSQFGIQTIGYVTQLGGIDLPVPVGTIAEHRSLRDRSIVFSLAPDRDDEIRKRIDQATSDGDTLGGVIEVRAEGLPFGLGTHSQWDQKLDGKMARAVMSVQAIKGVEIGLGFRAAALPGSQVHDGIGFDPAERDKVTLGFTRTRNNAGGLEAGMTNGQPLVVRAAMKPISTLRKPLESIDLASKQPDKASYERSDVCAVPAASVILQAVVAFELAAALVDKFGGDSLEEMKARWKLFQDLARERW